MKKKKSSQSAFYFFKTMTWGGGYNSTDLREKEAVHLLFQEFQIR